MPAIGRCHPRRTHCSPSSGWQFIQSQRPATRTMSRREADRGHRTSVVSADQDKGAVVAHLVFAVHFNPGPMVVMADRAHLPQIGVIGEGMVDSETIP